MWQQTFHSDGTKKSGSSGTYDSDFFLKTGKELGTKIRGKVGEQLTGFQIISIQIGNLHFETEPASYI